MFSSYLSVEIDYIDDRTGLRDIVKFDKDNFNYFTPDTVRVV